MADQYAAQNGGNLAAKLHFDLDDLPLGGWCASP